jgi:hypothetical protein
MRKNNSKILLELRRKIMKARTLRNQQAHRKRRMLLTILKTRIREKRRSLNP